MKCLKNAVAVTFIFFGCSAVALGQDNDSKKTTNLNIEEGYYQEQGTDENTGVASYNIEATNVPSDQGAAGWRTALVNDVEVLNIYSGKQDGNNVIRSVEVKIPPELIQRY